MAFDFEPGNGQIRGFFSIDTSSEDWKNWFDPGNHYFVSKTYHKTDGSKANIALRTLVGTKLLLFARRTKDMIDLFHRANIRRRSTTSPRTFLCYTCFENPKTMAKLILYSGAGKVVYLGATWAEAKKNFGNAPMWSEFWPNGKMDHVVFGFEGDAR